MTEPSSQLSESKQSIQWAATPFDKPKAESVILRSTDNIYFNVRRGILAEASPIFEDMFAQSSPAQDAALSLRYEDETIDGVPVVLMHETSFVIDFLFRLYHAPFDIRCPETIDDAFGILHAARKFSMSHAQMVAEQQFVAFAEKDPMRVYAVARRSGLPDEMRLAAKASLCKPLVHARMAELDDITGTDYCNLLRYRMACVTAATTAVRMESHPYYSSGFKIPWLTMKPWFLGSSSKKSHHHLTISGGLNAVAPHEFITFMKAISKSLAVCPVSKVVFDEQLWDQLWTSIVVHGQLSVCRRAANEVLSFQKELVDIIDSAISKVVLDID